VPGTRYSLRDVAADETGGSSDQYGQARVAH
jgi:hypothetical protein